MRQVALLVVCALLSPMATASHAQESDRFTLERTEDGFVRMDNRTGRMSICEERGRDLICRMAADEGEAYEDEIARLATRLDSLEERLAALESGAGASSGLPGEAEFERSLGYMERFFRRFMDIVRDFERTEPAPDRT